MNRIFLALICLFSTSIFFAQNVRFEGNVYDNGSKPLEMVNVMAVNKVTKAMDAYAITNDKGKFLLNLKANTAYSIKVSYIGMKNKEIEITTESQNISQTVKLEEGDEMLEGVEVVREMPVSISGDTIVYNADSFKSGTERKLEDVLKKLPGVTVNDNGEVTVEGKRVSKLMVEGKDFFDGDTKLGVKNIPADAIDKVQVLRNYNDIGALKGLENNEENVAMNIKLKDGKKNFWFGDFTAGIGVARPDTRYLINPKVFYYSPKYSLNLITNFNNIGELPLTPQDYFKFTGGFRNFMKKGGSNFNVSSNDLGISLLRNNRAKEIETQFGAANFSYNPIKTLTISGFGIFSQSTTDLETKSQTTVVATGDGQNATEIARQKNNLGLAKLSASYKPTAKLQVDYDVLGKLSKQDEGNNIFRQVFSNNIITPENLFVDKEQNPVSITQNLSAYYTMNDKNIFALEMQHFYQDEDPFYLANLASNPFPDSQLPGNNLNNIGITPQNRFLLNQDRFVKTNKIDAKLDYYYVLTPKSNINVTVGNTNSHQNFNSNFFQTLDNNFISNLNPISDNSVNYDFNDVFVGLHYKILVGKFTFNPGVSAHYYLMENAQDGNPFKRTFTKLLPDLYALWQIKKSQTLTYNFSITNNFTDINQLAEGYVLSNYTNLFRGNRELENSTSQVHSLRFFKFNMFNFENIFGNITYTKQTNAVKSNAVFNGINQFSTPYNSNFADETFSGFANYGRSFKRYYKASLSVFMNWSKFNNIQNSVFRSTESFTQNYTLTASTNYKKLPNLEIGYNLSINEYNNTKFFTNKPFAKLDYYFLDAFSFVAEYEFYKYYNSDKTVKNQYDFLTASLIYQKKDSKWEYKIAATNLLNTKSLNDDSFSQLITRTSQYTVQPRYVILSLKYNL